MTLIDQGLVEKPYWIQTVMGYQTSSYPTVDHVLTMLRDFPEDTVWLCSGIGPFQLPMTTLALLLGGHVRVGLEDNVYYRRGELARSNAQLVERAVRIARELGREIATSRAGQRILGLAAAGRTCMTVPRGTVRAVVVAAVSAVDGRAGRTPAGSARRRIRRRTSREPLGADA